MAEGILLICDEHIDISKDVKLLRFDDNWQLYSDDELFEELWGRATLICKGLGILVDKQLKKCRLIWENGGYKDVRYSNISLLGEMSEFIISQVGLGGLRDRAFEMDSTEIINKSTLINKTYITLKTNSSGWDIKIYKIQFKSGEILQYKIGVNLYYSVINREYTDWAINICEGYKDVTINESGSMIFEKDESLNGRCNTITEIIYKQEKIVDTFFGRLNRIDGSNNLYKYTFDKRNPLSIGNSVLRSDCIVRIWEYNVELVAEGIEYVSMGCNIRYYNDKFILWGETKLNIHEKEIFCGYALNCKGEYYFNGRRIYIFMEDLISAEEDRVKDIVAYYKDDGKQRHGIITLSSSKIMDIDDVIYIEDNGWLEIVSPEDNMQRYYYNGEFRKKR